MKHRTLILQALSLFTLLVAVSFNTEAKIEVRSFQQQEQAQRYQQLIDELRCLVCQNQNLADSNAELAKDLRNKVFEMITQNKSDKEIIDYMVTRYGDFVLYRPPFKTSTWLLWTGPFILLLLAFGGLVHFIRQSKQTATSTPDDDELKKIRKLLDSSTDQKEKDE